MTKYYRVSLGKGGAFASQAFEEGWIGTGWLASTDLTGQFPENWRDFNRQFVPVLVATGESKNNISAGLGCGMTWTVGRGIEEGDVVLSSNGGGDYLVGKVDGPYYFVGGVTLPHRRPVKWFPQMVSREDMSDGLRRATSSIGTVQVIGGFDSELERLIRGDSESITVIEQDVENRVSFVLEKHLEDFLVSNWNNTILGQNYDIYSEDGEVVGRQYPSDTGPMDILAVSKDGSELLVIELKRGRVSDVVVGQILRYMGYVKDLDPSKKVRGIIVGSEDDLKIRRALSMTPDVSYYRYEVDFKLFAESK
jgi:restriction system protein